MKRTIIIILVVGLIAGLGCFGFMNKVSAENTSPPPAPVFAPQDTVLVTIAENVILPAGSNTPPGPDFVSKFIDAKGYRHFKLYAKMTGPTTTADITSGVSLQLDDRPVDGPYYWVKKYNFWPYYPYPNPEPRFAIVDEFQGLYSMLNITAANALPQDVQVSIYLLMSKE